jgi:hypothetical protein
MTRTLWSVRRVGSGEWGLVPRSRGWSLALKLDFRDLWVGVYLNPSPCRRTLDIYVCVLPCFPVHLCLWGLP